MSKYLELAKKLKALADKGVGGEKDTADRMLKDLMRRQTHGKHRMNLVWRLYPLIKK